MKQFLTSFWVHFLGLNEVNKSIFLEMYLMALWRHFGRILGCLGALLVQIFGKKQYKTILKIDFLRYRSSLGWLLEAIWAHFGEV